MTQRRFLQGSLLVFFLAVASSLVWACGDYVIPKAVDTGPRGLARRLAEQCQDPNGSAKANAATIAMIRKHGQAGLDAAIRQRALLQAGQDPDEVARFDRAIDRIAGQKFASQSALFWHTDLEAARRQARFTGRPILSLRLLGRLDHDLSCANSRFFRTTLYPHPEIASTLRQQFVLHWKPVRNVPVVTIDFGDGRRLRQPITGNSVHLVLDANAHPIEALPGLVSPQAFQQWLADVHRLWTSTDADDPAYWSTIARHHHQRAQQRRETSSLTIAVNQPVADLDPLSPRWTELAESQSVQLASASRTLLDDQRPNGRANAEAAMLLAVSKRIVEAPMLRLVQPIEPHIARDTVFNLYALQTKIDDWFAAQNGPADYQEFTEQIYAAAFLMPLDDPWLGLSDELLYTALDDGGRLEPTRALASGGKR